ncbi:hydroxymethylbilane synthase [Caldiplasma sukawensis]
MRIGSRKSNLAMIQAELFSSITGGKNDIIGVESAGDINTEGSLRDYGGTGIFTSRLNEMVISGYLDCAVHSAKDLPSIIPEELEVSAVFDWKYYHDVLIKNSNFDYIENPVIGTSSPRREALMKLIYRKCIIKNLRGNIETRIKKLKDGQYDCIVLSEAAIKRLNINEDFEVLRPEISVPSPNQGMIAVVSRKDTNELTKKKIILAEDKLARERFNIEREIGKLIASGCSEPSGILYEPEKKILYMFLERNGKVGFKKTIVDSMENAVNEAKSFLEGLKW